VFPDAVELLHRLHQSGRNPVYYVSSSPWNLHAFLNRVFKENALIRGPIELRDFGLSETKFIKSGHDDHKGNAIDQLMAAHPDLPFVLIGDTGQQDPAVYAAVAARWPGRVEQVILRAPRQRRSKATEHALQRLDAMRVPVHIGPDFSGVALKGD
jgi:phosphatidate phosphatase APP1